jgi:hypothetical protein
MGRGAEGHAAPGGPAAANCGGGAMKYGVNKQGAQGAAANAASTQATDGLLTLPAKGRCTRSQPAAPPAEGPGVACKCWKPFGNLRCMSSIRCTCRGLLGCRSCPGCQRPSRQFEMGSTVEADRAWLGGSYGIRAAPPLTCRACATGSSPGAFLGLSDPCHQERRQQERNGQSCRQAEQCHDAVSLLAVVRDTYTNSFM